MRSSLRKWIRKTRLALAALALVPFLALATIHVNDGGVWRNITGIQINDGGVWRQIQQVQVNDAGTWRTVWASLSAGVDDSTASGSCTRTSPGNCTATTTTSTCSAVGGIGPFTYAWAYVSGTTATTVSPSAAATNWTRNAAAGANCALPGNQFLGTYRCTVTDTATTLTATVDVTVETFHRQNDGSC